MLPRWNAHGCQSRRNRIRESNDACAEYIRHYAEWTKMLADEEAAREDEYERDHVRQESRQDIFI